MSEYLLTTNNSNREESDEKNSNEENSNEENSNEENLMKKIMYRMCSFLYLKHFK